MGVGGERFELGTDYLPVPGMGGMLPFGSTGSLDGVETIFAGRASDRTPGPPARRPTNRL